MKFKSILKIVQNQQNKSSLSEGNVCTSLLPDHRFIGWTLTNLTSILSHDQCPTAADIYQIACMLWNLHWLLWLIATRHCCSHASPVNTSPSFSVLWRQHPAFSTPRLISCLLSGQQSDAAALLFCHMLQRTLHEVQVWLALWQFIVSWGCRWWMLFSADSNKNRKWDWCFGGSL